MAVEVGETYQSGWQVLGRAGRKHYFNCRHVCGLERQLSRFQLLHHRSKHQNYDIRCDACHGVVGTKVGTWFILSRKDSPGKNIIYNVHCVRCSYKRCIRADRIKKTLCKCDRQTRKTKPKGELK